MTESLAALGILVREGLPGADGALAEFHDRWQGDPLVVDKWLSVQASAPGSAAAARVATLTEHPSFEWKNPNKFRSLIGAFAMLNPTGFHAADGSGYRLFVDWLMRLDPMNPQTTARLAGAFETWRRYTPDRQALMRAEMERMTATDLSKNTREILARILDA